MGTHGETRQSYGVELSEMYVIAEWQGDQVLYLRIIDPNKLQ